MLWVGHVQLLCSNTISNVFYLAVSLAFSVRTGEEKECTPGTQHDAPLNEGNPPLLGPVIKICSYKPHLEKAAMLP